MKKGLIYLKEGLQYAGIALLCLFFAIVLMISNYYWCDKIALV